VIEIEWEYEPYEMIAASGSQGPGQFSSLEKMVEESGMLGPFVLPLEFGAIVGFDAVGEVAAEGVILVSEYELVEK